MAKDIDFEAIRQMSEEQQQEVYYTLAKRANQRMRDISKTGNSSGATNKIKSILQDTQHRDTFIQSKKLVGVRLKENLKLIEKFFTSKTATVKGIKEVEQTHVDIFVEKEKNDEQKKKIAQFFAIPDLKKKFFQFLSSQQFKALGRYADSDQIIEDFIQSLDQGFTMDEIMKQYDAYMDSEVTFEQLEELRQSGKILQ